LTEWKPLAANRISGKLKSCARDHVVDRRRELVSIRAVLRSQRIVWNLVSETDKQATSFFGIGDGPESTFTGLSIFREAARLQLSASASTRPLPKCPPKVVYSDERVLFQAVKRALHDHQPVVPPPYFP
jgi:hypothetical protein